MRLPVGRDAECPIAACRERNRAGMQAMEQGMRMDRRMGEWLPIAARPWDLTLCAAAVMRMQNAYIAPAALAAVSGVQRTAEAPDAQIALSGRDGRGQDMAARQLQAQGDDGDTKASEAHSTEKYDIEWAERELEKDLERKLEKDLLEDIWLYSMNEYVPKDGTCAVVRFYP